MKKISVIVPVYKAENVLKNCIDSILKQTFKNFELILVEDGSPDGSGKICDAYAVRSSHVISLHKENGGPSSAAIYGMAHATGDYVMFVDCDDWIEPPMLADMAKHLKGTKDEVVCCNYVEERLLSGGRVRQNEVTMTAAPGVYTGSKLINELQYELIGHEHRPVFLSRCFKLFSAELVRQNLYLVDTSIRMGDDVNMVTPILLDAKRVVILKDAHYYHYVFYPDSLVHAYDPGLYNDCVRLRNCLYAILTEKYILNAKVKVEREFLFLFLLVIKAELRRTGSEERIKARHRIRKLCRKENSRELLSAYPYALDDRANRLIAPILEKPTMLRIKRAEFVFDLQRILKH